MLRVYSWNPNGIRALVKNSKDHLTAFLLAFKPDVLFFSETKGNPDAEPKLTKELSEIFRSALPDCGWTYHHAYCTDPKGRHGVSVAVASNYVHVHSVDFGFGPDKPADTEGRVISLCCSSKREAKQAKQAKHQIIGVYVPNASMGLKRLQFKLDWMKDFSDYVAGLGIPSVIVGDINVAPDARDLCNPSSNLKTAGYTSEERESYSSGLIEKCKLVDVWRHRNPTDKVVSSGHDGVYSFWNTKSKSRERNAGWRIDLTLMSSSMISSVKECVICCDVLGSDHCPVGIEYDLSLLP